MQSFVVAAGNSPVRSGFFNSDLTLRVSDALGLPILPLGGGGGNPKKDFEKLVPNPYRWPPLRYPPFPGWVPDPQAESYFPHLREDPGWEAIGLALARVAQS